MKHVKNFKSFLNENLSEIDTGQIYTVTSPITGDFQGYPEEAEFENGTIFKVVSNEEGIVVVEEVPPAKSGITLKIERWEFDVRDFKSKTSIRK